MELRVLNEKVTEMVKWEELEGGIVASPSSSSAGGKEIKLEEQKEAESNEKDKDITNQHGGVHNFLSASSGRDIRRKKVYF